MLMVRLGGGGVTPPSYGQPDRKKPVLVLSQKNSEKISISFMDLLTFCPAPEILTLALPCPEDFYPCPAPPRPVGKNLAPSIPDLYAVSLLSLRILCYYWAN